MRILLLLSALLTALAGAEPVAAAPAARAHQAASASAALAAPARAAGHRPIAAMPLRPILAVRTAVTVAPAPIARIPLYAERLRV